MLFFKKFYLTIGKKNPKNRERKKEINNRSLQTLKAVYLCVFVFNRSRNGFKSSYSDMRKMCPQLYQTGDM